MMLVIHGCPESRADRTRWLALELGIPFRHVPTRYDTGETRTPAFLALNPNGHVPVIEEDGLVLWESLAINLYLARRHPGLWPDSVQGEGLLFQWSLWAMTELEPAIAATCEPLGWSPYEARRPEEAAAARVRLAGPMAILDGQLARQPFVAGPSFGVADIGLAEMVTWLPTGGSTLDAWPATRRWLRACVGRPAAQAVLPRSSLDWVAGLAP
ncbi:glutathione S-transferase family protein [Zavarzinia sp. CC-PAN008]|uniref:glutathione S-transferase family protein n=1 Tax=Zavarzinia sp. CC-PAN008 TaxID=3243332 RepID=UPI003F746DFD